MIQAPAERTQERRDTLLLIIGQDITFIIQEYVGHDVPTKSLQMTTNNLSDLNFGLLKNDIFASDNNGYIRGFTIGNSAESTIIETILIYYKHGYTTNEVYTTTSLDNGNIVVSCNKGVHVWNIETGIRSCIMENFKLGVRSMVSLGRNVVAFSEAWKSEVTIMNIETCVCVRKLYGHTDWVTVITSLGDGLVASGSWDNTIRVWDAETGICVRVILDAHSKRILSLASLGGGLLASSGSGTDGVKIWNFETGICLKILNEQADSLCSLGGGLLASGSNVGTVKIWG